MWVWWISLNALMGSGAPLWAGSLEMLQSWQPRVASARSIPSLQGADVSTLRAFVWRGSWLAVPVQVDELDPRTGLYVLNSGPSPEKADGLFFGNDELLISGASPAERAPAGVQAPCAGSTRWAELKGRIASLSGGDWVYVFSCPALSPRPSREFQLTISAEGSVISMPDHEVQFSQLKPMEPERLVVGRAWGGTGQNILNALHVEGQAQWLGGWVRLRRTLSDFISELKAWKVGPLRIIRRTIPRIRTYGSRYTNEGTFVLDSLHMPGLLTFELHMRSSTDLSRLVSSLVLQVAWEFQLFRGMQLQFAGPVKPVRLEDKEVQQLGERLGQEDSEWIQVTGGQGAFLGRISYRTRSVLEKRLHVSAVGGGRYQVGYTLHGLESASQGHSVYRADFWNLAGKGLANPERILEMQGGEYVESKDKSLATP